MSELRSWWTPLRWERAPTPAPYQSAVSETVDWDKSLEEAGYRLQVQLGQQFGYEIKVWRYPKEHQYVEFWDGEGEWASFFVSEEHGDAFMFDRLPVLMQVLAAVYMSDELQKIRRALVAYVRHGQDPSTIDSSGEESLDDRRRFQEQWRRRQAEKQS